MNARGTNKLNDKHGFSQWDLLAIIALLILGFLALAPRLARPKAKVQKITCASNLKQIGLGFRVWEGDNGDRYPPSVFTNGAGGPLYTNSIDAFRYFQVMSNELSNPQILVCPQDKTKRSATNFDTDLNGSHTSYFVSLNADESIPSGLLSGDSNLTNRQPLKNGNMELYAGQPAGWKKGRHEAFGYIGLADGSVQQFTSAGLQALLQKSGLTNRLLMPP